VHVGNHVRAGSARDEISSTECKQSHDDALIQQDQESLFLAVPFVKSVVDAVLLFNVVDNGSINGRLSATNMRE
jgi:hypothetical protein